MLNQNLSRVAFHLYPTANESLPQTEGEEVEGGRERVESQSTRNRLSTTPFSPPHPNSGESQKEAIGGQQLKKK